MTPHGVDTKETTTFGHASTWGDAWGIRQLLRQAVAAAVVTAAVARGRGARQAATTTVRKTSEVDRPSVKPPSMRWPRDRRASDCGVPGWARGCKSLGARPPTGRLTRLYGRRTAAGAVSHSVRGRTCGNARGRRSGRVVPSPHWPLSTYPPAMPAAPACLGYRSLNCARRISKLECARPPV